MLSRGEQPLIVQSDLTVLLDVKHDLAEEARAALAVFAVLLRQAGQIHIYQMNALSLWNAAASGSEARAVIEILNKYSKYELPLKAKLMIMKVMESFGKLRLMEKGGELVLAGDAAVMQKLAQSSSIRGFALAYLNDREWRIDKRFRGELKQELTRFGCPVIDQAGYHIGERLEVQLRERTADNKLFKLRQYQADAAEQLFREDSVTGGSGVIVMPCGAGKTIVGIAALARLGQATLILTSNATSVKQWKDELLNKTTLADGDIGQYCGAYRDVRPVTVATYHILTHRHTKEEGYRHMKLFSERDWGLIIYDEVHLLPAPVFRMTASLQATRRLGLTATLVREDGCAEDVYSLIGPKLYELQWKQAEQDCHIAAVACTEIRVSLHPHKHEAYREASPRSKLRLAAENPAKLTIVRELLHTHAGKPTLIIGQYLDQLKQLSIALGAPIVSGQVPQQERERLYGSFKNGKLPVLLVSKVANFAVDLPDAAVAIQLSGSFGSRQEEAQRIGRLLRPKKGDNEAWFYSIVTDGTKETEFAMKRQLFMQEQGYVYSRRQPSATFFKQGVD